MKLGEIKIESLKIMFANYNADIDIDKLSSLYDDENYEILMVEWGNYCIYSALGNERIYMEDLIGFFEPILEFLHVVPIIGISLYLFLIFDKLSTPPYVITVMVVVPTFFAVINPLLLMVATDASLDLYFAFTSFPMA